MYALAAGRQWCNCGGGRWEGRGEERNMAAGGGQMAARRSTGNMSLLQ